MPSSLPDALSWEGRGGHHPSRAHSRLPPDPVWTLRPPQTTPQCATLPALEFFLCSTWKSPASHARDGGTKDSPHHPADLVESCPKRPRRPCRLKRRLLSAWQLRPPPPTPPTHLKPLRAGPPGGPSTWPQAFLRAPSWGQQTSLPNIRPASAGSLGEFPTLSPLSPLVYRTISLSVYQC